MYDATTDEYILPDGTRVAGVDVAMGTVKLPTAVRGANGNGHKSPERPRLSKSPLSQPMRQAPSFADMSSQQRSASMDATVAQVAELTKANNQLYARIVQLEREQDTLHAQHVDTVGLHERRLDVLEQRVGSLELDEVFRGSSFMARLRWMFLGR